MVMDIQCSTRMLPCLFRRCATSLNVAQSFHSNTVVANKATFRPALAQFSSRNALNNSHGSFTWDKITRGMRAYSRKRNIFLDPAERDDTMSSFTELYGTSRFNDDDDIDIPGIRKTIGANKSASDDFSRDDDGDENDEDDDESYNASMGDSGNPQSTPASAAVLPPARNVKVKSAEFIKSSVSVSQCPPPIYPEFAVIGRSNVGKSSLINLLTGRNSLAMVSKTPGKTRCINHFLINNSWYLVDLPGYGYARTSKENVLVWNKFTREYFLERETLVAVLLLIDASIPPMDIDVACANWLGEAEVPYTLVYTKIDKRKKGVPPAAENIAAFEERLQEKWSELPSALATSSKSGAGKNDLLSHIARLRSLYNTNQL